MTAQQQTPSVASELVGEGLTIGTSSGEVVTLRGDVLSAPGRAFAVPAQFQDLYAFLTDGTMLVAQNKRYDPHVQTYVSKLQGKGQRITRYLEVEISDLKKVYAHARDTGSSKGIRQTDESDVSNVAMRRQLVELIGRAAGVGASDIHIVSDDYGAAIQMRIDGIMMHVMELPIDYAKQMMAAASAMGTASDTTYNPYDFQNASIVDADGKLGLPKAVQSIRLQWNPLMLSGRYLVMRLHYSSGHSKMDLGSLGFSRAQLEQIRLMRQKSTGIVVISGPTGSGKSTTLKNALSSLLRESNRTKNIVTVEDPPEFYIEGIKQMQVMNAKNQEERKAKFTAAIMAALRDDPDVIMIGEIRDFESGSLAYDAANTGHGVWTSLHANNAIAIINRLLDLGLEPYKVTDHESIIGLIGQRLIRKLCPHCKLPAEAGIAAETLTPETLKRAHELMTKLGRTDKLYARSPRGCQHCRKKGFSGRTVASEVITPDETFMNYCRDQKKTHAREHWVKSLGGFTMMTHGVAKMLAGIVSPDDVERSIDPLAFDVSMSALPELIDEIAKQSAK